MTDGNSYEEATNEWLTEASTYLNLNQPGAPDIPVLLVGNKTDLDEDDGRVISTRELKQFNKSRPSIIVKECSAKTGKRVNEVFQTAAQEIVKRDIFADQKDGAITASSVNVRTVNKKGCCDL